MAVGSPGAPDSAVPVHRTRPIVAQSGGGTYPRHPAARGRSRLRLSNWRVRTKLIAALLIPTFAFLVMAGAQTVSLVAVSTAATGFAAEVELVPRMSALIDRLQDERDRTAGELAPTATSGVSSADVARIGKVLAPYRAATDREIATFTAGLGRLPRGHAPWEAARARTGRALDALDGLRDLSLATALPPRAVFDTYCWTIETLIDLMGQTAQEAVDETVAPVAAARITSSVELARAEEVMSQLRGLLLGAARAGTVAPTDLADLTDLRSERGKTLADFRAAATEEQVRRFDAMAATEAFRRANELADQAIAHGGGTAVGLDAAQWWTAGADQQERLRDLQAELIDEAVGAARAQRDWQVRRTLFATGTIAAVLLIALLTSYAIGRSMHRSLRLLRGQALEVAQLQLPEVIARLRVLKPAQRPVIEVPSAPVRALDEIGEVAEAFTAVHRSAVELAVEQAVMRGNVNAMFVNLARRSQVLVERQLELLDELEREEGDPEQLESLFKLDHLAARMRRNDENLLVLAGSESIRRWSEPVELSAVTLAAIAEIEQYPKVRHGVTDHIYVVGHVVSDLVHLLAELLENATTFSPPASSVLVTGGPHSHGSGLIQIADRGMGMSPTALAEANELLAAPPAVDVAASERMGLFVVSHLAARHGIRVKLRPGDRGLVASVWLPATLLAAAPTRALADAQGGRPMITAAGAGAAPSGRAGRAEAGSMAGPRATPGPGEPDDAGAGSRVPVRPGRSALHGPGRRGALNRLLGTAGAVPTVPPATARTAQDPPGGSGAATGNVWFGRTGEVARHDPADRPELAGPAGAAAGPAGAAAGPATPAGPARPPVRFLAAQRSAAPAPGFAPAESAAGATNASGLPVRVPMAQLPGTQQTLPGHPGTPNGQVRRAEPDPDAVGSTLSRFHAGVRRAEVEDDQAQLVRRAEVPGRAGDAQTSAVPAGPRIEEEQQ